MQQDLHRSQAKSPSVLLARLCRSWLTRSAVRNTSYVEDPEPLFDPALHDFPPGLLPFKGHPAYARLEDEAQRRVQAYAWIAWNRRVVDTEEQIVCKSLLALLSGATDFVLKGVTQTAIRHTLIDEAFHSHMHDVAASITVRARALPEGSMERLRRPGYASRRYAEVASGMSETWEKEIARLAWAVVGELSIYEFLTLVSNDVSIQKGSRVLLDLHEKDEAAHAGVVAEVMRAHFHELGPKQRACFLRCLPLAMDGLSQQDWLVWRDVLEVAGVAEAAQIVEDCAHDASVPAQLPLLRSYERIESLCDDLGIALHETPSA